MENYGEISKIKEENEIIENEDILDTTKFSPAYRQLMQCNICNQQFTNKLKILMHWIINHDYKLCNFCSNYAFKYDSDKIQHEQLHLPIGCSSCNFEFSKYCVESISEHYKKDHHSFLCNFCSGVIQPFSKYPEHVEKKHNTISYAKLMESNDNIFEMVDEADGSHFVCLMCDKKKHHTLLFGHFIFYHNLSVHVLKKYLDKTQIKINGSSLKACSMVVDIEDGQEKGDCKDDVCTVCDNPMDDEISKKELHGVFCRGFVVCKQCTRIFKNENSLKSHMEKEHPAISCKFGCKETSLSPAQINEHLQNRHDITECFLCNIINSSGQFKNHLRDQHGVNLMTYEKAMCKTTNKLFRAESNAQVFCNFCDKNLTNEIKQFSFINHYKDQHEITITMILQNLDKNPIIDVILSDKNLKEDETLKNFAVVNSLENFVETDFDASKVYCIGVGHVEQKPFFMIENDSSSKLICDFCSKQFEVACRLYEHLTSIHGFRLLNLEDCDECHSKCQSESSDEDSKSFNLSLVCPFDESYHVTKDNFKDHMEAEHLDDSMDVNSIIYKCIVCNYAFKNLEDIRNHFNVHHPDVKINYCKICRYKLPSNGSEDEHFSLNHPKDLEKSMKFCCKLCSKEFKKSASAKSHYKKTHHTKKSAAKRASGQYKCHFQQCSLVFENTEDRKMHVIIQHPDEKAYKCKTCDMRFTTKGSLSSHSMKHKNLVYTCEFCNKTFTRRDSYKEHLLIHSDVRLKCSFCEKVFVQRSNLVRHERIHLQDKPYKCSYCEKTFSDKGACKSHENVHTKEESSNCSFCGKHFARKLKLKYHMRLHTLEDVVTCEICGKHFGESYSLRKHRETHEKAEKVDKCNICDKSFKTLRALRNHQKSHEGEEEDESLMQTRITCTICNMSEFTTTSIKAHLADVHKVSGSNWENYIDEVEFEMDIEPEMITP